MKRITATEARRNWFRILDEVAAGAIVVIERHGRHIVLRREEPAEASPGELPSYESLLRVPDAERAGAWGWDWGTDGELVPRDEDPPR